MRRETQRFARWIGAATILASTLTVATAIPPGEIILGNVVVFRLRNGSGKLDLTKRTDLVQERVNQVLGLTDVTAKDVHIKSLKEGPTLYVRNIKLITIDADTANAAGVTPDSLAKQWAHRLMGVIDQVNVRLPAGGPPATPPSPTEPTPSSPMPPDTPTPDPAAPPAPSNPPATPNPPVPPSTPTPAPGTPAPGTPTPAPSGAPTQPTTPQSGANNPKGNA